MTNFHVPIYRVSFCFYNKYAINSIIKLTNREIFIVMIIRKIVKSMKLYENTIGSDRGDNLNRLKFG